jgi:nucleotide-sensitive chloride channel 1A
MGTHESKHLPDGASPVVFLQVNIHDPETTNSDDEIHTLDLTIYTTAIAVGPSQSSAEDADAPSPVKTLFEALSACADLHPDPNEDDAAEGGNTEPGAGGWITAENMNDFLDADGNFVAPTTLGPGAGNVHSLEDEEDESKWRRTT